MVYDIAGLRIRLENAFPYTTKFCKGYLSDDQQSPVDIVASVSQADFEKEKAASPNFSDGYIENICLYRSLCLQLPLFQRMLLHCSVLEFDGKGYAFLGRSGTGKSTHTKLWLKYLPNTRVINGDKPILHFDGNGFVVYGTPWQGKENWGCNANVPLKGLCFLEQAKQNSIRKLSAAETSMLVFRQVLLPENESEAVATLDLIDKLICSTPAYILQCDISEEAVKCSFEKLTGSIFQDVKLEKTV